VTRLEYLCEKRLLTEEELVEYLMLSRGLDRQQAQEMFDEIKPFVEPYRMVLQ
jgi:hypothetical protein